VVTSATLDARGTDTPLADAQNLITTHRESSQ